MRKEIKHVFAFLIIWICSGMCFAAFQNDNILIGIISAALSSIGYWLMD